MFIHRFNKETGMKVRKFYKILANQFNVQFYSMKKEGVYACSCVLAWKNKLIKAHSI